MTIEEMINNQLTDTEILEILHKERQKRESDKRLTKARDAMLDAVVAYFKILVPESGDFLKDNKKDILQSIFESEEDIKKMIKIIPDLEFAITSLEDPKEENFEKTIKDFLDTYVR